MFPILNALASANCPHGSKASFLATSTKVMIEMGPVFITGDQCMIVPCAFTVPTSKPQPCVKGVVVTPASKVLVEGKPVIVQGPADMAQSAEQIPAGPLVYGSVQMKVLAT
jgi:uncharacterized Zn-binding protein involved in type VI secretion